MALTSVTFQSNDKFGHTGKFRRFSANLVLAASENGVAVSPLELGLMRIENIEGTVVATGDRALWDKANGLLFVVDGDGTFLNTGSPTVQATVTGV